LDTATENKTVAGDKKNITGPANTQRQTLRVRVLHAETRLQ
jgi:hypothetical protein